MWLHNTKMQPQKSLSFNETFQGPTIVFGAKCCIINKYITKMSIIDYNFSINPKYMLFVLYSLFVLHNDLIKY